MHLGESISLIMWMMGNYKLGGCIKQVFLSTQPDERQSLRLFWSVVLVVSVVSADTTTAETIFNRNA